MHDSVAFYGVFNKLIDRLDINDIKYFLGDAAYKTPHICKILIELGLIPLLKF